jgi:hypothetical protein
MNITIEFAYLAIENNQLPLAREIFNILKKDDNQTPIEMLKLSTYLLEKESYEN